MQAQRAPAGSTLLGLTRCVCVRACCPCCSRLPLWQDTRMCHQISRSRYHGTWPTSWRCRRRAAGPCCLHLCHQACGQATMQVPRAYWESVAWWRALQLGLCCQVRVLCAAFHAAVPAHDLVRTLIACGCALRRHGFRGRPVCASAAGSGGQFRAQLACWRTPPAATPQPGPGWPLSALKITTHQ